MPVGRVIGTEDATPLEFWVAVAPGEYLQLDDVVALRADRCPTAEVVRIYGVVSQVRARHEGARFDSDVFLIAEGVLPAEVSEAALVQATRFEPEVFVPPLPGAEVRRAAGAERDEALFFDGMAPQAAGRAVPRRRAAATSTSSSSTAPAAPTSTSAASRGVATKTTYATFLLYSLFSSGVLGAEAANTKALIFNVKGEDLLFLDHPNTAPRRRAGRPLRPARPAGGRLPQRRRVRAPRRRRPDGAGPTSQPGPRASPRSSGRSPSSAATSCCRSSSPTPRTTASSTRWSCTT